MPIVIPQNIDISKFTTVLDIMHPCKTYMGDRPYDKINKVLAATALLETGTAFTFSSVYTNSRGYPPESTIRYSATPHISNTRHIIDEHPNQTFVEICLSYVKYNVTDTFEHLPIWVRENDNICEMNNMSLYLKCTPKHRIRVYRKKYNDRHYSYVIFSNKPFIDDDIDIYSKICGLIPLMDTKPFSSEATELFKWIATNTATDANELVNKFTAYITEHHADVINELEFKRVVEQFDSIKRAKRNKAMSEAEEYRRHIQTLTQRLKDVNVFLQDKLRIIAGIDTEHTLTYDEIKSLVDSKAIVNLNVTPSSMTFTCYSYLINYDADAALTYYDRNLKTEPNDSYAKFFKAVFIDKIAIINMATTLSINLTNNDLSAAHVDYIDGAIPNPHHAAYNCWGNYSTPIATALGRDDLLQLALTIKTAVGSLNMVDYPVLTRFRNMVYNYISNYPNVNVLIDTETQKPMSINDLFNKIKED